MRLRTLLLVLLMLLTVTPSLGQGDLPTIEWTPCWMDLPSGFVEGEDIECGYLLVLENRSQPDTTSTIELAFAIVYAPAEDVQPEPVIYLAGGPGGNAVADVESWLDIPYLGDRDLILLDQRGTGYSLPSLNCPEVEAGEDNGTEACRERLIEEGVDLQAYNSAENAADVADLRVALEYDEWNLYGISYGTRLALTVMRDYPEGVRSVIIDSVYPPEVRSWEEYGQNTEEMFHRLFEACAADSDCNAAFPNLEQVFYETAARLDAAPVEYEGVDADTGELVPTTLSGSDLIDRLFVVIYSSESIPYIPWAISEIANDNYAALDDLEYGEMPEGGYRQVDDEDISDSEGMNISVECQEEIAFLDEEAALANVPDEPESLRNNSVNTIQATFADCQVWGVEAADPIEAEPVVSDIPTLVAAGEFDPITPAKWAESAASYLPNSFLFVFPGGGHGVIDMNACSQGIMQDFLDNPTREPDASCIADMGGPVWVIPSGQ